MQSVHSWLFGLLLLLAGCGFHLKGYQQADPALDGLFVEQAEQRDSLAGVIQRELVTAGVKLADTAETAKHRLRIRADRFTQRVLSVDASGKALEYELSLQAGFDVAAADGSERLPLQSLELLRQLTLSGQDELGYRNEAALLRIDMRLDMADQIIRRLQAQLK